MDHIPLRVDAVLQHLADEQRDLLSIPRGRPARAL